MFVYFHMAICRIETMTSYEEEDQYPGGEDYGSLPKFQQFDGPGHKMGHSFEKTL
jgi:hypothetical protein